jgi:hypothetical protein
LKVKKSLEFFGFFLPELLLVLLLKLTELAKSALALLTEQSEECRLAESKSSN